jgi:hypothetical protein
MLVNKEKKDYEKITEVSTPPTFIVLPLEQI